MPGWSNLDHFRHEGVDVIADLDDCLRTPLPYDDNSVDEIFCSHVFEHLKNPLSMMQELHRISKNGTRAVFKVPYGSSDDAYEDPTHVRQCYLQTFQYFSQPFYWRADYGYRGDWEVEKILLSLSSKRYSSMKREDILEEVDRFRNVVKEMTAILIAIKPIRPPHKQLRRIPPIDFVFV